MAVRPYDWVGTSSRRGSADISAPVRPLHQPDVPSVRCGRKALAGLPAAAAHLHPPRPGRIHRLLGTDGQRDRAGHSRFGDRVSHGRGRVGGAASEGLAIRLPDATTTVPVAYARRVVSPGDL